MRTDIGLNSIGAPRSQRFHLPERRSRTAGSIIPARSKARYTAEDDGTDDTCRLTSSNTSRRGRAMGN